jgi:hypothetical protein
MKTEKLSPFQTIQGMGEGVTKENGRVGEGEFNYELL